MRISVLVALVPLALGCSSKSEDSARASSSQSTTGTAACHAVLDANARCGAAAPAGCEQEMQRVCEGTMDLLNPDFHDVLVACGPSLACQGSFFDDACITGRVSTISLAPAAQVLADTLCSVCGGTTSERDATGLGCQGHMDDGTKTIGRYLLAISESAAMGIQAACPGPPGPATNFDACAGGFFDCMMNEIRQATPQPPQCPAPAPPQQ